ncbi:type II toxin-antitoxin system RelE/ParE family toxin [Pedobacter immunditicola]|uniref:type II toxin-antitoxin system RelE/ParE family toxin n=1 Tax=Pedobacter immunditicola TaxID=3133440 RepID=UPI0030A49C37
MEYAIIWSPTAQLTYFEILNYLVENWTEKELIAFVNRTEIAIHHIATNPLLFPYSKESDTHKCVIVKQVSLIYRINSTAIELLVFWDNRQDPNKSVV